MQNVIPGCQRIDFDWVLLSNSKGKHIICIYRCNCCTTCWVPAQFRLVGRFLLNHSWMDGSGLLMIRTTNLAPVHLLTLTRTRSDGPQPLLTPRVSHLRSDCPAWYLLHHHHRLPHAPHCQNLQDRSDNLWRNSTSPQMLFRASWLSMPPVQQFPYPPARAWSMSLGRELGVSPQRSIHRHNADSTSHSLCCIKSAFRVVSAPLSSF